MKQNSHVLFHFLLLVACSSPNIISSDTPKKDVETIIIPNQDLVISNSLIGKYYTPNLEQLEGYSFRSGTCVNCFVKRPYLIPNYGVTVLNNKKNKWLVLLTDDDTETIIDTLVIQLNRNKRIKVRCHENIYQHDEFYLGVISEGEFGEVKASKSWKVDLDKGKIVAVKDKIIFCHIIEPCE